MSQVPDPQAFFTERLPAQFNRTLAEQQKTVEAAERVLDGMRAVDATLAIEVRGEGGGTFFVNIQAGRSSAATSAANPPFLTLVLDRGDYEPLYTEAGDNVLGFLGGVSGMGADMKLTGPRIDLLRSIEGTLRFEMAGEGGFTLLAHFGPEPVPDEPAATIRVEAETYRALRAGRAEPQQAFMDGKIQVEGDMQLAMNLALAVLSPD